MSKNRSISAAGARIHGARRRARPLDLGLILAVLATALACGGRIEPGSDETDPGSDTDNPGGGGGNAGDGDRPSDGDHPGDVLPKCVLGFKYATDPEHCAWLADKLCYRTKLAACACVCPLDHHSQCVSGFPGGPASAVPVTCS